jgi:DNA primase
MSSTTEKIKERLGIHEVVLSYIKTEKAGKNYKAVCPFHNEKTPSFFISPERNTYYCFGCNAKGDIFSFVQEFEGIDFPGALKTLADRAGVTIEKVDPKKKSERERSFSLMELARDFFIGNLKKSDLQLQYLKGRGLDEDTIEQFHIGLALDDWHTLETYLKGKGYTEEELLKVGLLKKGDKGVYDTFRNRIIFPITDSSGRTVAFAGRAVDPDDPAKYLNSPETVLFNKSDVLFGFDKAKIEIRKYNFSILVEGPLDLIMAHQGGFKNTVAMQGTSLTPLHIQKLKRLSTNLVIALDADTAGVASAIRSAEMSLRAGMDVKIASLPSGKDPADVVLKDKDGLKNIIREARHIVDFLLKDLSERITDKRKLNLAVSKKVVPYVAMIENSIDQSHFVARVADYIGVSQSAVENELAKVDIQREVGSYHTSSEEGRDAEQRRRDLVVRRLRGFILWQATLRDKSESLESAEKALEGVSLEPLSDDEKNAIIFEAELIFSGSDDIHGHIKEMTNHLKEDSIRTQFSDIVTALKKAESEGNIEQATELLKKFQDLSVEMESIKNI